LGSIRTAAYMPTWHEFHVIFSCSITKVVYTYEPKWVLRKYL
jgi:hypothetical protein